MTDLPLLARYWRAFSVRARAEKRVAERLSASGVEVLIPLRIALHKWSDRKKRVEVPPFPSYVSIPMPTHSPSLPPGLRDTLAGVLARHPAVGLAVVYGSVARGKAGPESDLDLAVMGNPTPSAQDRLGLIADLGDALGRPVDLVDLRQAHGALLGEILQTGVRVLERDPGLYPAVLARHLLDEADFGPLRARVLAGRRDRWLGDPEDAS